MKLVIDLQGSLSYCSRNRGVGRYSQALAHAMARHASNHEVVLALNGVFADAVDETRALFDGLVEPGNFKVWYPPANIQTLHEGTQHAAEQLYEGFLASLRPDVVHISSLFEGLYDPSVTSVGRFSTVPTAVTLYDLIPLVYPSRYFTDKPARYWYSRKLQALQRADVCMAISDASRQEGIALLGLNPSRCINVSSAADPQFMRLELSTEREQSLRNRHGLHKPFVMYTGGTDYRKNLEGLIRAYARLPVALRDTHQLAIVCALPPDNRDPVIQLARTIGLPEGALVLTGLVPEQDLIELYNLCRLFVFPSLHEGFGLPVLEAMHCGAPVIAANNSSLPEVLGRDDALFDGHDDQAMAAKMAQALRDDAFRRSLSEHGLQQAARFSWDESARRAIEALEALHATAVARRSLASPGHRPRLAYVSPLPPEAGSIASYSAKLLPHLSLHYEIDLITDLPALGDPDLAARFTTRSVAWFRGHADAYDRVLYHFGNSELHQHMFDLLAEIPGTVVLHDFHLSDIKAHLEFGGIKPGFWTQSLYESHGYPAVAERFHAADPEKVVVKYPACFDVIRQAQGVIAHSPGASQLADQWYGAGAAKDWTLIRQQLELDLAACAQRYFEAIERFAQRAAVGRDGLIQAITRNTESSVASSPPSDLRALAEAIAESLPPELAQRQLLIDVSELVQRDARTGIQRVVKSLLKELLASPPPGWRIEPVYAIPNGAAGYRYARRFTLGFLGCPVDALQDEPIAPRAGDVFIGLDLQPMIVAQQRASYQKMRQIGTRVEFVVYDLLPVLLSQYFGQEAAAGHERWLEVVAENNGALSISRAVADELHQWMVQHAPLPLARGFRIGAFHLGAEVQGAASSTGLPADHESVLLTLSTHPAFLMVGTIEPRKGHAQVLDAFETLWQADDPPVLVVVGKQGWMVESLVERLQTHPQRGHRLFWLPSASDEYLTKIYAACVCLIAASFGEGFGLPLIEAAHHGLPILARDLPVFREVAEAHATYFEGDAAALATAIQSWLVLYRNGEHPHTERMPYLSWSQSASQFITVLLGASEPRPVAPCEPAKS